VDTSLRDLWHFRRPLVETLLEAGVDVWFVGPRDDDGECERQGVKVRTWNLDRGSAALLSNAKELTGLARSYRELRPALVHQFGAKPIVYGSIAARLTGGRCAMVSTVTGLGHVFTGTRPWLQRILTAMYRAALPVNDVMVFMNGDDPRTLGVGGSQRIRVTRSGEGVDTDRFSPERVPEGKRIDLRRALGLSPTTRVVMLVSRMLAEKGVREFVEAAAEVRRQVPGTVFVLVGGTDEQSPSGIQRRTLEAWHREGKVMYLGRRRDVPEMMALATTVVLPSYYREGIPQVLLEGAAMAKPLVATDVPGCREVVAPGVNGFLVPPRDVLQLSGAISRILRDEKRQSDFGRASRALSVERFDRRHAVAEALDVYRDALRRRSRETAGAGSRAGCR
jgi:glycosyltransferase involved in cell wall biosynthesis